MTDENNGLQGDVVFWNGNSFGFIKPDTGDQDVFFHVTDLPPHQSVQGARLSR
jgi:cold shock CspA family protein